MPTPTSASRESFEKCQRQRWVYNVCPTTRIDRGQSFFPSLTGQEIGYERERCGMKGKRRCIPGNDSQPTADEKCWDQMTHPRLTSEGLRQWEMHAHVDHVYDLVPFWQRGMDAAEKGEVLRLEEFLDKMEGDGGWRTAKEVLGMLGGWTPSEQAREYGGSGWGKSFRNDWDERGVTATRVGSDTTESSREKESRWGVREEWAMDSAHGNKSGWGIREDWAMEESNNGARDGWGIRGLEKTKQAVRGDGRKQELRHLVEVIARQEAVTEERRREMHLFLEMTLEQKVEKIEETIRILRTHGV